MAFRHVFPFFYDGDFDTKKKKKQQKTLANSAVHI